MDIEYVVRSDAVNEIRHSSPCSLTTAIRMSKYPSAAPSQSVIWLSAGATITPLRCLIAPMKEHVWCLTDLQDIKTE